MTRKMSATDELIATFKAMKAEAVPMLRRLQEIDRWLSDHGVFSLHCVANEAEDAIRKLES